MSTQKVEDCQSETIRAEVEQVYPDERGGYIVLRSRVNCGDLREMTSITVSLRGWQHKRIKPRPGMMADLENTALWANGWRAETARPVTPQR
jgi:hypothetical protein